MKKHPILCAFAISELLGMITYLIMFSFRLTEVFISGLILGTFMIFPILLTLLNIYYLILCNDFRISRILDLVILTVGTLFSCILLFIQRLIQRLYVYLLLGLLDILFYLISNWKKCLR